MAIVHADRTELDQPDEDELAALAMAADPDAPLDADAVDLGLLLARDGLDLLPSWYMPAPSGGRRLCGWRRWVGLVIVASFILINAYGLCSTYGHVGFG
jgi:hypothetical protein